MKKKLLLALSVTTLLNAETLKDAVGEVLSTSPIILERLKNYNATKEDITIAKSGYYPKIDLSLGAGYENTRKKYPSSTNNFDFNVYQNSLTYTQNLFKGFETTYQVKEHENRTLAAAYNYIENVNATAFEMVKEYIEVLKQKELLDNAQENIDINKEVLGKVQKLYDSGLTTLSEVNKIQASLALAKSNYIVQENTLLDFTYKMHKVFGRYIDPETMSKPKADFKFPDTIEEATQFAMLNNPSILVQKYNIKLAQATYQKNKSPFYPNLDISVSETMSKNTGGTEAETKAFKAMAYLTYNIFNGFADSATLQQSVSQIHQEVQIKNELIRKTITDLKLSWAALEQQSKQLEPLREYKNYAEKTLELYKKEYDLGRRSLLDLLSAQNDFIGAKAQIINTEYSALYDKYRILDAMGVLVTNVMGNTDVSYSSVGLKGSVPQNKDSLPILLDTDTDLITDDRDICNNSLNYRMRGIYGCEKIYEDTQRIERYSGFLFEYRSAELNQKGEKRFKDLIAQLKPYGFKNLKFDVLGNVDDETMDPTKKLLLSAQRASVIKEKLIEEGAIEQNITVHALSDKAPMYTNGLYENEGVELNNRVDIVVRKLKKQDTKK